MHNSRQFERTYFSRLGWEQGALNFSTWTSCWFTLMWKKSRPKIATWNPSSQRKLFLPNQARQHFSFQPFGSLIANNSVKLYWLQYFKPSFSDRAMCPCIIIFKLPWTLTEQGFHKWTLGKAWAQCNGVRHSPARCEGEWLQHSQNTKKETDLINVALVLTYWVTAGNLRNHLSDPKEGKCNLLKRISLWERKIILTQVIKSQ